MSVVVVGVTAFVASALVGLALGIPEPKAHDEFSYLLAADTFARGRLTNPTHPMWIHLETFHVIHEPTYMSKYQPAQGLILAIGKILFGHPIFGVWLSVAFMCASICWMLGAWLTPRWALLGGLLAIIHPNIGVTSYWAQSYWGGALPATGGALILGGFRYLSLAPTVRNAMMYGLGMTILANSRPYEGLVLSIPVALSLLFFLLGKNRPDFVTTLRKILLPLAAVGVISLSSMAYYNYRVAGSVLRIPYQVNEKTYDMFAYFIWQELPPEPFYRHQIIRDYHAEYELPQYQDRRSLAGFVYINFSIAFSFLLVMGNVFLVPVVGALRPLSLWACRDPLGRRAILILLFFASGLMFETVMSLHYGAPITALVYFIVLQAMRIWREDSPGVGRIAVYVVPLMALGVASMNLYHSWSDRDNLEWHLQRARLLSELGRQEGKHLIVVKYGPRHSYFHEWVYNDADIDGSKVVWARAMDSKEDCRLVEYFKDRKAWSLAIDHDESPVRLKPLPTESCH